MNLIEFLREKLTTSVTEKISNFLGEPQERVDSAMQATLPTILGGLVQQGTSDEGAKKIMDIIKDGGHTGDILDNMPNLLANYDKSQLLVTIGTNIFNHFFGNTSSILTDKVASLSNISKSSSTSLLGLTAPMVLGAIGYVVQKENLGISGLKKLLDEQRDDVSKALPQTIAPHLPLRSISPVQQEEESNVVSPIVEPTVEKRKEGGKKVNKKSIISNLLPWLFLIILALLSAYYLRTCKTNPDKDDSSIVLENDTLTTNENTGIIDESADTPNDDEISSTPTERATPTPSASNQPSASNSNRSTSTNSAKQESSPRINAQRLRSSRSWMGLSSSSFRSNSAEIRNRGEINAIASYLQQNPNATISIAPAGNGRVAEDRAYAIREQLYQKGVDVSRINIEPARGSGSGVAIKLNR